MPSKRPFNDTSGLRPDKGFAIIAGGATGNHVVTGIQEIDELEYVAHLQGDGTQLTGAEDLTGEFDISADDQINNTGGTTTTNGFLMVSWFRRDPRSA